jgi:hypothetical protein
MTSSNNVTNFRRPYACNRRALDAIHDRAGVGGG